MILPDHWRATCSSPAFQSFALRRQRLVELTRCGGSGETASEPDECDDERGVRFVRPNVRGEAGPTALRLARAVHHVPQALRGQGAMPLGLASTEGLGSTVLAAHGGPQCCLSDGRDRTRVNCPIAAVKCFQPRR